MLCQVCFYFIYLIFGSGISHLSFLLFTFYSLPSMSKMYIGSKMCQVKVKTFVEKNGSHIDVLSDWLYLKILLYINISYYFIPVHAQD